MKNKEFKKAIQDIHNISMTSSEKEVIFQRITQKQSVPVHSPWSIYSFGSWIQGHKLASVVIIMLIVAMSGNSLVLASQESLPGNILYKFKVNITEPLQVAFASDPIKKAEIQTSFLQARFEEAETLATRGLLDSSKEQEITELLDKHVAHVSDIVEKERTNSPERVEDTVITIQASMNAHARILNTIAVKKHESPKQDADIRRIANKAKQDAKKFDTEQVEEVYSLQIESSRVAPEVVNSSMLMSLPASEESGPAQAVSSTMITDDVQHDVADKNKMSSKNSFNDNVKDLNIKKQEKEAEIYEKAKERLEKEQKREELRTTKKNGKDAIRKGKN